MREYLYLWHDPTLKRLVASGIEFRDFVPELTRTGGIVLLRHKFGNVSIDEDTGFDVVSTGKLAQLKNDDVYNYGDFIWADIGLEASLSHLTDEGIAELAFFAHTARLLRAVEIPGLQNHFLYRAHDDGWYARIYYSDWRSVESILRRLLMQLINEAQTARTLAGLRIDKSAFWICRDKTKRCKRTEDIDSLQSQF